METDEMELDTIGDRKTALFVIISDTDDTFNFVVSILYTQLFNLLCDKADDEYGGRLPVHVRCLLDEFANIGQIPKFEKLIATIRSREISASIILQSQSQLSDGWKGIEHRYLATLKDKPDPEDGENEGVTLPELSEGQGFENPAAKVTEHTTTPPKPHSEASLLSAMERAGNGDIDPDAERRGLGTPATRAAVIEKLVKGGFAERKGKQLIPTQNGAALISVLPDMLTSPQLTAEWENNLTQIAKGAADPGEFLSGIEAMARELVQTHAAALEDKKGLFREEKPSIGKCPRCGSPVHEGKKNYYCSNRECAFVMWKNDRFFEERKTAFSTKIAAALLKSGKANVKKLYSPKTGNFTVSITI